MFLSLVMMVVLTGVGYAQEEQDNESDKRVTLQEQFNDIYKNSESYNEYKVIKGTRLKSFWKVVDDSLNLYRAGIGEKAAMMQNQIKKNKALQARIEELEASLESSTYNTDRITIFGISLKKNVYNWIVWLLIAGLTVVTFYALSGILLLKRTSNARKKESNDLVEEFEEYRKKSYDAKIKMGRELQDERNLVEDLKAKLSTSSSRRTAKSQS